MSRTTVLGTVVVERVVDTVMVVAIAALAVVVLSVRGVMSSAVLLGLAFVALLVIGLGLGMAAHRLPGAARVTEIIARWPRVLELARRLREGLAVAGRPRTLAAAIAFSALAWAASTGTFLAPARRSASSCRWPRRPCSRAAWRWSRSSRPGPATSGRSS